MKPNDEVIYSITISGIKTASNQSAITELLPTHIGTGHMSIMPATKAEPGMIEVERLFTRWRGDTEEKAWQSNLMEAVKAHNASIAIDVQPWGYANGYPQGDTEL